MGFSKKCLPFIFILAMVVGCAQISPITSTGGPEGMEYAKESEADAQSLDIPGLSKYPEVAPKIREVKRHCQLASLSSQAGDNKKALEELDKAYSILLGIDLKRYPELAESLEDLRYTIAKRIIQVHAMKAKGTKGVACPIPLDKNRHVMEALEKFQGPLRDFFMRSYQRSLLYRPMIVEKLKSAGLPEELSWLPLIESGFNVRAFSPARALGMWQFIASTGYRYGLKRDQWVDERMDPEKSTDAAILYLKELHALFGDWTTALAAYNCGEANVLRVIRTQKVDYLDNFWDLYERLPKETAFYVPQFIAVLHIVKSPATYGFVLTEGNKLAEYDVIEINKSVSLSSLEAECNLEKGVLSDMNPELRRSVTPPYPYSLKVPKGKKETVLAAIDNLKEYAENAPVQKSAEKGSSLTYKVKKGDTLQKIAEKYNTTVASIKKANNIKGNSISVGRTLIIPSEGASITMVSQKPEPKASYVRYKVKKGDTLRTIADEQEVSLEAIKKANNLKSYNIKVGQVLLIPKGENGASISSSQQYRERASSQARYVVKKGDSLYAISKRFGMSLSELMELNKLKDMNIYPGQVLYVAQGG